MANEHNLKPIQSESEAREKGRQGGIKSGEARREKRDLKKELELALEVGDTQHELVTGIINKAKKGDVKAFNSIYDKTKGSEAQDGAREFFESDDGLYMQAFFSGCLWGDITEDESYQVLEKRGRFDLCEDLRNENRKAVQDKIRGDMIVEWYKSRGERQQHLGRTISTWDNIIKGWDQEYYDLFRRATEGNVEACDKVIQICNDIKELASKGLKKGEQ